MGALLVAATVTPANAATNTITIGASPTLTGRQLITVSITVVCDPLPDTPFASGAWVSFRQTSGKQINTASGFTDSFSGGPSAPMLTCDGVTQNTASSRLCRIKTGPIPRRAGLGKCILLLPDSD
jgi:hypothetical protein